MAKNTGEGKRVGTISGRTQTYNPKSGQYIKRGEDGKFMASKDTPFKSIKCESAAKIKKDADNKVKK